MTDEKNKKQIEKQNGEETDKQEKISRSGRYRTKPVTREEKLQYYKDYYLIPTIIALVVLALAASLVKSIFFDRTESALSVVVMAYQQPDTESLSEALRNYLEIEDEDQTVSFSMLMPGEMQSSMALSTWIAASSVDLLIMDPDTFHQYAQGGYLAELQELMDEDFLKQVQPDLKEEQIAKTDEAGEVTGYEKEGYFGIGLSYDEEKSVYTQGGDDLILAVVVNTEKTENVLKAIPFFLN